MNTGSKLTLAALCGLAPFATPWMAQAQDGASAVTNLLVLPAQSSRASVRSLMKQYERELGVSKMSGAIVREALWRVTLWGLARPLGGHRGARLRTGRR